MNAPRPTADVSPEKLAGVLEQSRLLTGEPLQTLQTAIRQAHEENSILRALRRAVEQGLLTRWQSEQLLEGRTQFFIDKYRLLQPVGKGGMGVVYKAEHSGLGRIVALKLMSKDLLKDDRLVQRFIREIHAVASLSHPNIVRAYDADAVGGRYYLVMEFVAGKDLGQMLKQHGRLELPVACECILQAACGLQHAHESGLVHRDIKPGNLLVTLTGGHAEVKLLDLGLARFVQSVEDGAKTKSGVILGTIDYMSPEQVQDTHSVDIRSDIFALGCTLFHALTGRVPFAGKKALERLVARTHSDAPRLRSVLPEAPAELDCVLAKMLARLPDERYSTPAEVVAALTPFVGRSHRPYILPDPDEDTQVDVEPTMASQQLSLVLSAMPESSEFDDAETLIVSRDDHALAESFTAAEPPRSPTQPMPAPVVEPARTVPARRRTLDPKLIGGAAGIVLLLIVAAWLILRGNPQERQAVAGKPAAKPATAIASTAPSAPREGFARVFNGKSLEGWTVVIGPESNWKVEKGMLISTGQAPGWIATDREYGDYLLDVEWKGIGPADSGISARCTPETFPDSVPGPVQVQLRTTDSGMLLSSIPPQQGVKYQKWGERYMVTGDLTATEHPYLSFSQWNRFEIEVRGRKVRARLNDVLVTDAEFAELPPRGAIALESWTGRMEFRKIEIRELDGGE